DVAFDPTTTTAPIAYAAVGGFNANTPATPGHVFEVDCTTDCASFTWFNKTGNLPDIPVDSIIANPRNPRQVFAGTDWGLYYTDDITVPSPTWSRFENGLPHAMIWDMQIDRGNTTLSVWTRGRGAYVWPLPFAPVVLSSVVSRLTHGSAGTFDVDLTPPAAGIESRSGGVNGDYTIVFAFGNNVASVGGAAVTSGTGSVSGSSLGSNANEYVVHLTGVTNLQRVTVTLTNVQDNAGHLSASVSATMGVLIGDTTANGMVNSTDVTETKSHSGGGATAANFRTDITADGAINGTDVSFVKSKTGTSLPNP
ncbi:MAG TPA: dockerin type I domain-containing protein, partial [Chthoniobacterales bacterium]|nr:dockerin type I domain-containing protein [Chthoniobacterales bacterium]